MKNKAILNNKKGFTLAELVVSLSLALIVMLMISSIIILVTQDTDITALSSKRLSEYIKSEQFINNWFYTFNTNEYELVAPNEDKNYIEFRSTKNSAFSFSLKFDETEKTFTSTSVTGVNKLELTYIDSVTFDIQDNLLKVTLTYCENPDEQILSKKVYQNYDLTFIYVTNN